MQPSIYCIGIGGAGMVWLADYCLAQGWSVSGSDLTCTPTTIRLEQAGAVIHYDCDPSNIPADITEVIINSAITETSRSYPELVEVQRRGLPVSKRAVWTGKITRQYHTIAVCGTHGKTTTTAMLGWILDKAGLDPTVFVGGSVAAWGNATKIGSSNYLIIEADEFDRSFHQFSAEMAIILNIDPDHLDYYKGGIGEIEHSFRRFLRNLPAKKGVVVGYGKDASIRKVTKGFSYAFRWYDEKHLWPGLRPSLPGTHILLNATAAARIAHELGVDSKTIQSAIASFPGVARRFEHLGAWNQVEVYDDYAHHPREIAATLQAAREKFKDDSLTVVFQAHQKSRTLELLKEFAHSFEKNVPNHLIIAPIFEVEGREEPLEISNTILADQIRPFLPTTTTMEIPQNDQELQSALLKASQKPGIFLSMGAGSISANVRNWMSV